MKLLIVGESPSRYGAAPLEGGIGKRLSTLAGVSVDDYLTRTVRANLFAKVYVRPLAVGRARGLIVEHWPCEVVALGVRVARAFGVDPSVLFRWQVAQDCIVAVCPHPSGRNRWWNDPQNEAAAAAFWKRTLGRERRSG